MCNFLILGVVVPRSPNPHFQGGWSPTYGRPEAYFIGVSGAGGGPPQRSGGAKPASENKYIFWNTPSRPPGPGTWVPNPEGVFSNVFCLLLFYMFFFVLLCVFVCLLISVCFV